MKNPRSFPLLELLAIIIIFAVSFVTFKILFEGVPGGSFFNSAIAVLIGAVITVVITAILLRQQAKVEEVRERNVEVFKKKVEYFEKLTKLLIDITDDGKIDPLEASELQKAIYSVSLFCSIETLSRIGKFLRQNTIGDLGEDVDIFDVLSQLRKDLKLEGIDEFEKEEMEPIELLISSNFEQLPAYQEIYRYLKELSDRFEDEIKKQELEFAVTMVEGLSNSVFFSINTDSSNGFYFQCGVTYPRSNAFKELYVDFQIMSSGFILSKNESKFIEELSLLDYKTFRSDVDDDTDAFGFKKVKLQFSTENDRVRISKNYSKIVKPFLNEIQTIEKAFVKPS